MFASCGLRFCLGGLLVLLLGLLACPSLGSGGVSAMENTTAVASTNVIVNAAASVAVSVDSSVVMDAFSAGWKNELVMGSANLKVRTNNEAGYSMYIATTDNTTSMVNYANLDGGEITALTSDKLSSEFEGNSWGYSLMEGTVSPDASTTRYSGISKDMTMIANPSTKTEEDSYTLAFAAQIDQSLSSGQYMNSVMISVVANPATINDLNDLIYMQDMTPEICKNTKAKNGAATITPGNEVTKQLIDIRDGKKYWVAKLADNNCWMTQNLALDLQAGQTLTSETTDLENVAGKSWAVPTVAVTSNKLPGAEFSSVTAAETPAHSRSWNVGEWVTKDVKSGQACGGQMLSVADMEACTLIQNVGGWRGTWDAGETGITVNEEELTYDAHYLTGNLYQWNAATAGTAIGVNSGTPTSDAAAEVAKLKDAPGSICPKGWRLPVGGAVNGTVPIDREDSYYRLFLAYGYPNLTALTTPILNGTNQNPFMGPMKFARGGVLDSNDGKYNGLGLAVYQALGTAGTSASGSAMYLTISAIVRPTHDYRRATGYSVRCVVR